jgi:hypothetical protein
MQHLEVSGTPVLYIGRRVLKGKYSAQRVSATAVHSTAASTKWRRQMQAVRLTMRPVLRPLTLILLM